MKEVGEISPNARIAGQNNTADTDDSLTGVSRLFIRKAARIIPL